MDTRETALHSRIKLLTNEISAIEDQLSQKTLRQRLYGLRSQREKLLAELGELQAMRETRREPPHAAA
jgi:hypothetical protein